MEEIVAVHQPVMGTVLHLRIAAEERAVAAAAEQFIVEEARSLERRLTWFDPSSEFSRWRAGEVASPSPVLTQLLTVAAEWQQRSAGAFNPTAGVLSQRWRRAAAERVVPSATEMADLAASIAAPRYSVADGEVLIRGDVSELNLNAVAKGFVVDRVAEAAWDRFALGSLLLNAGGDLRRIGEGTIVVGIEDPHRPYDNVAPLDRLHVGEGALATSGSARRWFDVGGQRFNQVLDPFTGWPVAELASVSVVAADAATADVLATVLSVAPTSALGVEAATLIVGSDGSLTADERWAALRA